MVERDDVLRVKVGSGKKAHLFVVRTDSSVKAYELRDGGYAYDRAMCGAGGRMELADDDLEDCSRCQEIAALNGDD